MGVDRRGFFKIAGLSTLAGMAGKTSMDALAQGESRFAPNPEALHGKRWAMVVDMEKCKSKEGCKDCILACHQVHNVPDFGNPKDEVKWIWKEQYHHAFPSQENEYIKDDLKHANVLVFCNHCDNPPCVRVCPTQATWDRKDGIVMMDWHRCIGCRYCIAACPYGSRSFNWRDPRGVDEEEESFIKETNPEFPTRTRGVVEKCTFCDERLAQGLLPACVEACTEGCLKFGDLEDPESEVRKLLAERFSIRRKPELGTQPEVYYLV
ncbi:MAG: 4Fe-4S dicluster domain-containing protein [Candidatus Omnitrophota bacterium]|jgi:molybdopterin-containing oxidoreductase family iron-sulfur binding subunit|nr:MAG: 4Fe-4S dicluster domain-containing protein [Candidatus Omnitrophota bacterium]